MLERRYDVAVIKPQSLLGIGPRFRELGMIPEEAYQLDLNESQSLMEAAYERAVSTMNAKYGVDARIEFERFVPDEIAGSGKGGAVQGVWEFVSIVFNPDVPTGLLNTLITHFLVESIKELTSDLILRDRLQATDEQVPSRRYTADGIKAICEQHAERTNPGLQLTSVQVLENPDKTSIANEPFIVTVGFEQKQVTYTIAPDGEPLSIVETVEDQNRLLPTDEWRKWYLTNSQ